MDTDITKIIKVRKSPDFKITGDGTNKNWLLAEWVIIPQRTVLGERQETKMKIMYSTSGIYFLFSCEDNLISATYNADFMNLWEEDVVEVFLWPDDNDSSYFEYEISPLNYELPILINNNNGDLVRWQPFHYDVDRRTRHATSVEGGEKKSGAAITNWMAEFYIPFKLMRPLKNISPLSGSKWKANFYRVDYDGGDSCIWSWQSTKENFHEIENFSILSFE